MTRTDLARSPSRLARRLGAASVTSLAMLLCAACASGRKSDSTPAYTLEIARIRGHDVPILIDAARLEAYLGSGTLEQTGFQVSGGAVFSSTVTAGSVAVNLTDLYVTTEGTDWNMQSVAVHAGSGAVPASLPAPLLTVTPANVKEHTIDAAQINGEPNHVLADGKYWIKVVVTAVKDGTTTPTKLLFGLKEYKLLTNHLPSYFTTWEG